jgi:NADH dehydrogenase FAD-containing subunit
MDVDPVTLQSGDPDIFAGGDAVSGPKTVVEAIAAGKTAAESIRRYLSDEDLKAGRETALDPVEDVDLSTAVPLARQTMPMADPLKQGKPGLTKSSWVLTKRPYRRKSSVAWPAASARSATSASRPAWPKRSAMK